MQVETENARGTMCCWSGFVFCEGLGGNFARSFSRDGRSPSQSDVFSDLRLDQFDLVAGPKNRPIARRATRPAARA